MLNGYSRWFYVDNLSGRIKGATKIYFISYIFNGKVAAWIFKIKYCYTLYPKSDVEQSVGRVFRQKSM